MEKDIRVLVANRPQLMRELVLEAMTDQPDIEIVGEVAKDAEIVRAVEWTRPDCMLMALEDSRRRSAICETVLHQHPEMRIVAVVPNHKCFVYYWASVKIHSHDVEASEEGILRALRAGTGAAEGRA